VTCLGGLGRFSTNFVYLQFANRESRIAYNQINMKQHHGMRPQDIVVLLKIIASNNNQWRNLDIAYSLKISPSEVSEVLNRCKIAKLINKEKREVHLNALTEFLIYGLKYVFPAEPGAIAKGIPTAHSATPIKEKIISSTESYVWPNSNGNSRGQSIDPLYKTVPDAAMDDQAFYELIALVDTIRIGKAREVQIAIDELNKRIRK
jgi:predicted transcriptional regulator